MSSEKKSATTETKPYGPQQPHIQQQLNYAGSYFKNARPSFYPGTTVSGLNYLEKQSMDAARQGAMGNMDPVFENVRSRVMPAIDAAYSRAGRTPTGAGSYGAVAADALTNAYAPIAQQQYNTDQERLYRSGQDLRDFYERRAQEDAQRHTYNQNLPWDQLARYQNAIQLGGSYGSTTQPYYTNPTATALGGIASLGSLFF